MLFNIKLFVHGIGDRLLFKLGRKENQMQGPPVGDLTDLVYCFKSYFPMTSEFG